MPAKFKFQCPACSLLINAPPTAGGKKVACPKCTQRLLIPMPPPQAKTILGRMWPDAPEAARATEEPLDFSGSGDAPIVTVERKRATWGPFLAAVGVLAMLFVGAWGWNTRGRFFAPAAVVRPEVRKSPRTPEEEAVQRFVLANANDPKSVEFDRWGPHLDEGVTWPIDIGPSLFNVGNETPVKGKPAKMLRTVFRGKNQFGATVIEDKVFIVQNGEVVLAEQNNMGDRISLMFDAARARLREEKLAADKAQAAPPSSPKPTPKSDALNVSPKTKSTLAFNSGDLDQTMKWLAEMSAELKTAAANSRNASNAILLSDKTKEVRIRLDRCEGSPVKWNVALQSINAKGVFVNSEARSLGGEVFDEFHVHVHFHPQMILVANQDWLRSKKRGDRVAMTGTISKIDLQHDFNWSNYTIRVADAAIDTSK